jgi:cytochrome c biogenesis protein CcmG/thiol:disulfide interchange protein DsbE
MCTPSFQRLVPAIAVCSLLVSAFALNANQARAAVAAGQDGGQRVDPRWIERLDSGDRALIEENIGYAPPSMPEELTWHGGTAMTWADLCGRVVVVQSFTTKGSAGRAALDRSVKAVESVAADEVVVVALHTPEGVQQAGELLAKRDVGVPVMIDSSGRFCDEFGFYKRPTNVVIDRNGRVRFAGLTPLGLKEAVSRLVDESFDESVKAEPRPAPAAAPDAAFPSFNQSSLSAQNIQGRKGPEMYVQEWLGERPDASGKVVIIDFWATWCGPCVASIPHMNDLADRFRADVVAVGLSDEDANTVRNFMRSTPMRYAVAVDASGQMKRAIGVSGIPHVMVLSSDWVVRWQGHPARLDVATVQQIVEANKSLADGSKARYRWSGADTA